MSYTETAGTSLPQNCPELEPFIKAQAHIRAAAGIIDELTVAHFPHLSKQKRERWNNLASETIGRLWETYRYAQDLTTLFLLPPLRRR